MANDLFEAGEVGETRARVAMLVRRFPPVSGTFVMTQGVGLMRLGHEVGTYSFGAQPPNAALTQPDVAQYRLLERTEYPAASPRDSLKFLHCGVRQAAMLLSKRESNSVSGGCAGLSRWRKRAVNHEAARQRCKLREKTATYAKLSSVARACSGWAVHQPLKLSRAKGQSNLPVQSMRFANSEFAVRAELLARRKFCLRSDRRRHRRNAWPPGLKDSAYE